MKSINDHLMDEYNISCNYYETKYNYLLTKINEYKKHKPLKIFKNKYSIWQKEIDMLYKELDEINKNLNDEYKKIEALI